MSFRRSLSLSLSLRQLALTVCGWVGERAASEHGAFQESFLALDKSITWQRPEREREGEGSASALGNAPQPPLRSLPLPFLLSACQAGKCTKGDFRKEGESVEEWKGGEGKELLKQINSTCF